MFEDNNGSPQLVEESHYYAFGMRIEGLGTTGDNKYLYNGKEVTDDHGLNWYEYGWRMYDPQIGRWLCVDPLDQYYSPFCFVDNNPINVIDPNGTWGDPEYKFVGQTTIGDNPYVAVFDLVEEPDNGILGWLFSGDYMRNAMRRSPYENEKMYKAWFKAAEAAADFVTFNATSTAKTFANWNNSSKYEQFSAGLTVAVPVLGKAAGSLTAIKYIENPWNYFQSIKGGSSTANSAAYWWWKNGIGGALFDRKTAAFELYNQSIPAIQAGAGFLNQGSSAKSVFDLGYQANYGRPPLSR
jgi:RHS repeat-associated protein